MAVQNYASKSSTALVGSTDTLAYGSAVTAGDTLIGHLRMGTATTLNSITDSVNGAGSPWTIVGPLDNVGREYFFYFQNTGAGTPTLTATFGAAGQSPRWDVGEITNTPAASHDADSAGATGNSQNLTGAAVTNAQATSAVIGFFTITLNETFAQNGNYTILGVEPGAGSSRICIVYQEVTSIASWNAAVDVGTLATWTGFTAIFKQNAPAGMPAGGQSSDLPIAPGRAVELRTWLQTPPAIAQAAAAPINQYDWPLPRGYGYSIDLRTWILGPPALAQAAAPPITYYVGELPRGYPYPLDLRTYIMPLLSLVAPPPAPITYYVGELPRGYAYPLDLRTFVYQSNFPIPASAVSGAQIILLLPDGRLAKKITNAIYEVLN